MVKHDIILCGYGEAARGHDSAPQIVKRTDAEFIPGLLAALRQGKTATELGLPDHRGDGYARAHLFQPVHRTFNLLVLEAACKRPGFPRLDPRSIESAGLVVRRVGTIPQSTSLPPTTTPSTPGTFVNITTTMVTGEVATLAPFSPIGFSAMSYASAAQGWMHQNEAPLGWLRLENPELDPDPARRPRLITANHHVNERLATLLGLDSSAERVSPLFVAPPDVCEATGRTLLYGIIPVTSTEQSAQPDVPTLSDDHVGTIMPSFLRAIGSSGRPSGLSEIDLDEVKRAFAANPNAQLTSFLQDLRMIQFGWRAFDADRPELKALLNRIVVRFNSPSRSQGLGDFLQELCAFALLGTSTSGNPRKLPDDWPVPNAVLAQQLRAAVRQRLQARLAESVPPGKRFDDERALYVARAFVRVPCREGCPAKIHWSEPTECFSIAPWWENGGPIHTIALPDLDPAMVKKLKPNVAFSLPPKLAAYLNSDKPGALLQGGGSMDSPGLGWICSFSIPVITICAFILLNIILSLLHLVFQWLFYVKICLPFPKPPPPQPSS